MENKKNLTKSEIKADIAKTLAKKRESRKLNLENISSALKIRVPVLKAIETGQWDDIPGGVYLKEFLKKYATYLGLEAEKLIAPYFQPVEAAPEAEKEEEEKDIFDPAKRYMWIMISISVLLMVGMIRFLMVDSSDQNEATDVVVQEQVQTLETEDVVVQVKEPESHELLVFSPHPLWLRVEAEDRSFEGFIPQGSTWSWTGVGKFMVRLGHTKDISMNFDGQLVSVKENQTRITLPNEF